MADDQHESGPRFEGSDEPHATQGLARQLNWLRAGVLGANDGIVSTAGVVVGVAGATVERGTVLTAGIAALVAGALSMAVGEYVSVSTQRDTESALLEKERAELRDTPDEELAELTQIYVGKGLDPELASRVAVQLTAHDALAAHAEVELQVVALLITGLTSARLGGTTPGRQVARNVAGGLLAMAVTYAIGSIVGTRL